jgi:hypothetical protein
MRVKSLAVGSVVAGLVSLAGAAPDPAWKVHDAQRPQPPRVSPGTPSVPDQPGRPPSDAILLFDGRDLSQWVSLDGSPTRWVLREGALESVSGAGYARTLQNFGDCQLHVEFATPARVSGDGQGRGNSGVFLMGRYEVQVLDSFNNQTYADGQVGAAYGQYPPLVNAALPPGQWQTYDIVFARPRFDAAGKVVAPARFTVLLNGVLVQNHVELTGPTGWLHRDPYQAHDAKLPLALQDHGNPVRFRNIWVRDLEGGPREFTYGTNVLHRVVGVYRLNPQTTITVSRQEDQLLARWQYPKRDFTYPLVARSPLDFFVRAADAQFQFKTNDAGVVQRLILNVGGGDQEGVRE